MMQLQLRKQIISHQVFWEYGNTLYFFFTAYSLKQLENAPGMTLRQIIYTAQIIKPEATSLSSFPLVA